MYKSKEARPNYASFSGHFKTTRFWTQRSRLEKILCSIILSLSVTMVMVTLVKFVNLKQPSDNFGSLNNGQRMAASGFVHSRMLKRDLSNVENLTNYENIPKDADDFKAAKTLSKRSTNEGSPEICFSEGCIHTASKLLDKMNQSVNPCDDFYRFTCGKFLEETVIPDEKSEMNSFSAIGDVLVVQLRTIIEEPPNDSDIKPFKLAKDLYKVCMNESQIEEQGLDHIKSVLKELGGWPVLEGNSWNEDSFSWESFVYKSLRYGYSGNYFLSFGVGVNLKDNTQRMIDCDEASLGLNRQYLIEGLSHIAVKAYYDYMVDVAVMMGADRETAVEELKQSLDFEIKLATISLSPEDRRNLTKLFNPMNITTLEEKFPSIPWEEYINTILSPQATLNEGEDIIVAVPSYVQELEKLLSTTPKRVMANYVLWRVMTASVSFLNDQMLSLQLAYSEVLTGSSEQEPRWKNCISTVSGSFWLAIGSLYVRKHFKEAAKSNVVEMVQLIREEMKNTLDKIDWMDPETKQAALNKLAAMTTHIAYPEELLDNDKLEEFYMGLEVRTDNFLEASLNVNKFMYNYSLSTLREPVNKTDWKTHGDSALINAFYSFLENSILLPAGILQGAFFSNERPNYMNYGAIGFVIGHEIIHGFDDQGSKFDKDGNLVDWWDASSKEKYDGKAQCIIDQYGNYRVPEVNLTLNGENTIGENIADNGGVKQAYNAYGAWVARHGEEPRLPGLQQFSPRQMFWISAASTYCWQYRVEALELVVRTDTHSPGEFRVLYPLSNSQEFARDFECPLSSRQNPTAKCEVW